MRVYTGEIVSRTSDLRRICYTAMEGADHLQLGQLPDEMYTIIKAATTSLGPRLGRLALSGRKAIETPHYLGITSRGVIPHITQDNFTRSTNISGVYVGLEDCKYLTLPIRAPSKRSLTMILTEW